MKVKDLVKILKECNQGATIYFSQDEEGNTFNDQAMIQGFEGKGETLALVPFGNYLMEEELTK